MSTLIHILIEYWLTLAAVVAAPLLYFTLLRPLWILRRTVKRYAQGDFTPPPREIHYGIFRPTMRHVRSIGAQLERFDAQITAEGFSLRAILASMIEGVMIVDYAQNIHLVNDTLVRMFDFPRSPAGKTVAEAFANEALCAAIAETFEKTTPTRIEIALENSREKNRRRHYEVHASAFFSDPNVGDAVVVFHDITTIHELEAVRREFISNVSHEFRTPLTIINGYIETLIEDDLEDRDHALKALATMRKNALRIETLMEDILIISRLENRTQRLDLRPTNLRQIFDEVAARLAPAIAERHALLEIDWHTAAETLPADERRMEQVFANLIENALRYGATDNAKITVKAHVEADKIHIFFSDNGEGIPLADQPHIFERFYRVHKDRSRNAGGTGLGLSIIKHIIQAHGGTITLESAPTKGATFLIQLPVS